MTITGCGTRHVEIASTGSLGGLSRPSSSMSRACTGHSTVATGTVVAFPAQDCNGSLTAAVGAACNIVGDFQFL